MKYQPIDPQLFIQNRKNFTEKLKPNSIAIFNSNDEMPRSADQSYPFRQNSDIFYLSGIDQEESILVLYPDCPNTDYREMLFLKETNEHIKIWEGDKYTKEAATKVSGIKNIFWIESFNSILSMVMHWSEYCYLNTNENDRYVHHVAYRDLRFIKQLQERFPLHHYERAAPVLRELRMIKSDKEVKLLQEACDITDKAFRRVLNFVKPRVAEYEIEAEITHEFLRNRANGHAYYPIIASGKDTCVLHYNNNDKECKDGDLILLDFGADYGNYAADLSRTIPVNGKFTDRQRDVYNGVLRVMKGAIKLLVPGNNMDDYLKEVGEMMEDELIKLKLLDAAEVKKQDPAKPLYKKYFMHGTSHHLGLDVHDFGYRYATFKEGMVFTCEPGIYIPDESIGVRIENDILITANGNRDLMGNIPVEAEEIEELMNSK